MKRERGTLQKKENRERERVCGVKEHFDFGVFEIPESDRKVKGVHG